MAFSVSLACRFDCSSKLWASSEILLIKGPLEPQILATLGRLYADADRFLGDTHHLESGIFKRCKHPGTVADQPFLRLSQQPCGDGLSRCLPFPGQVAGRHHGLSSLGRVRVCQAPSVALDGRPSIDSQTVGGVVVGLEPLAAGQLDVRYQKVELDTALVSMLDP